MFQHDGVLYLLCEGGCVASVTHCHKASWDGADLNMTQVRATH